MCGITSLADALLAVDNGADALGFVFFRKSPRNVTPEAVVEIVKGLPPFVSKVGVFVDSPLEMVVQIMSFCKLDLAQLHGCESPEYCEALYPRVIKAFRVGRYRTPAPIPTELETVSDLALPIDRDPVCGTIPTGPENVSRLTRVADYRAAAYLLDAYSPRSVGGTGETFDWEIARAISPKHRVILAGGLTPANVRQAIDVVRPYGVDVSTGVESGPGKKDVGLVRAFIRAAKGVVENQ